MAAIRARTDGAAGALVEMDRSERDALAALLDHLEPMAARSPRVTPPAYPDEEQLEAEYRHLTGPDLEAARTLAIATMRRTIQEDGPATALAPAEVEAWLRGLNALRIALADEIGIESDGWEEAVPPEEHARPPYAALHALGWIQEELLAVVPVVAGPATG